MGWRQEAVRAAVLIALAVCFGAVPADATGGPQPRDAVIARVQRLAAYLPERAGGWQQNRGVEGDGILFASVAYRLGQTPAWATVSVSHPMALTGTPMLEPVPDGPDSPLLRGRHDPPGPPPGPDVLLQTGDIAVPDAPAMRCGIARYTNAGRRTSAYRCATGVAGLLLVVRVTAPMGSDDTQERGAVDRMVVALVIATTSSLARAPAE